MPVINSLTHKKQPRNQFKVRLCHWGKKECFSVKVSPSEKKTIYDL